MGRLSCNIAFCMEFVISCHMAQFYYFAYGSNMLVERLQDRCPSANFAGSAYVCGYELQFSKRSKDCSGKATIVESKEAGEKLYGALFQIEKNELDELDRAEGPGYERQDDFVVVRVDNDQEIEVSTYFAKSGAMGEHLKPYSWYKQLILWGAIQAKLPGCYLTRLIAIEAGRDPVVDRNKKSLEILKGLANCVFSKGTWDLKIADQLTVADWKAMKSKLVPGKSDNWKYAFNLFFMKRIKTRYFEPIRLLQDHGENKGEGFSIVALQCSLIEFLASTRTGKNYKHGATEEERRNQNKYSSSQLVFTKFLRDYLPFKDYSSNLAGCFYTHVRCALLHEARTKGNWKILADAPDNKKIVDVIEKTGEKTLYRNNLQKAFKEYIDNYGKELVECKELQKAFIRKFDYLCEE